MIHFFQSLIAVNNQSDYDVIVLTIAGQSNARGNTLGDNPTSEYIGLAGNSLMYNYASNQYETIDFNNNGSLDGLNFGIDLSFSHTASSSYDVLLNKRAEGSTSLQTDWQPNTTLSNNIIEGIDANKQKIIDLGYTNPYWVFYWNQGEKDANDGTTVQEYIDNWNLFFNNVELNQVYNQIFICQTNSNLDPITYQDISNVRAAQLQITQQDSRYTLIDMDDYPLGNDNLHYEGVVQEQLGVRVFNELNL